MKNGEQKEVKYVPPDIKIVKVSGSLEDFLESLNSCFDFEKITSNC